MWENTIGLHIRRSNRRLLVVNGVFLALLVLWAAANQRYLYNCLKGPLPTTPDALMRDPHPDAGQRYYVSLDQLKTRKTGLQRTETSDGRTSVVATYFTVAAGSKVLLIQSPVATPSASYEGALVPVSDELRDHLQKTVLDSKHLKFDDVLLPYMLDAGSFQSAAWVGLGLGLPLALLLLYNIWKALQRMNNLEFSPIARSLQRFGQMTPSNIAMIIEQDLKTAGEPDTNSALKMGSSWLVHPTFFGMDVLHRNEILWVYEKVTSHSVNFVPTGKTYALVIGDDRGRRFEVAVAARGKGKAKEQLDGLLRVVINRFPWVVAGYSDQRKIEYEKNREAFVTLVRQRQAQYFRTAA
jgi:hypothetical protein